MSTIKVKMDHDDYNDIDYYRNFEIIDEKPNEIFRGNDVKVCRELQRDIEDRTHGAENYRYYHVITTDKDADDDEDGLIQYYVAVPLPPDEQFV